MTEPAGPADTASTLASRTIAAGGHVVHFVEAGTGEPIVFLHGNPTSSFLWREVIPSVARSGHRCLAMDLPGMGRSSKPGGDYPFRLHAGAVDGFLDELGLERVTLVLHDWGVALGLDLLRRRPDQVGAIAFMEGHVHPIATWDEFDEGGRELFRTVRSEDEGRRLVIDENLFIETVLPSGMRRRLSQAEMDAYRAPFVRPEDRDVIWRWVRSIPIAGEPAEMDATMRASRDALVASDIPKLLFHATPGAIIGPEAVAWFRESLTNLTVMGLGDGLHFLPEDHGPTIGHAIAEWVGSQ